MCGIFFYAHFLKTNGIIPKDIMEMLSKIKHRGPDETQIRHFNSSKLDVSITTAFHRLAITDLSHSAMQPFEWKGMFCLVNGEIWNYKTLSLEMKEKSTWNPHSKSDCEVILPLFDHLGKDPELLCKNLDGEYSLVIYDSNTDIIYVGTDELSVRPLFLSLSKKGFGISSESKSLIDNDPNTKILRLPCSSYGKYELSKLITNNDKELQFISYFDWDSYLPENNKYNIESYNEVKDKLKLGLISSVKKKLYTDRKVGFLLSGGLDSSLVCSIASKLLKDKNPNHKIDTFTIGIVEDINDIKDLPEDIESARKVAKYIDSNHHELFFTIKEALNAIPEVIRITESWDETTIRASTPMYLGVHKIKELYPEIAVIFSGEVADELLQGYIYNHLSPSPEEGRKDTIRLLKEIHCFDGLRADRIVASSGCELRLPFFDKFILQHVLESDPKYFDPKEYVMEKHILRDAFTDNYLPESILWRTKQALSDASSHNSTWKDSIKEYITSFIDTSKDYSHKLSLEDNWYKSLYNSTYIGYDNLIPHKWLPPKEWCPDMGNDSSATTLDVYKKINK